MPTSTPISPPMWVRLEAAVRAATSLVSGSPLAASDACFVSCNILALKSTILIASSP